MDNGDLKRIVIHRTEIDDRFNVLVVVHDNRRETSEEITAHEMRSADETAEIVKNEMRLRL